MSIDHYQFQMIHSQEWMTHAERLAADEQAGRMAYALYELGRAVGRAARAIGRGAWLIGATMQLRRSA